MNIISTFSSNKSSYINNQICLNKNILTQNQKKEKIEKKK